MAASLVVLDVLVLSVNAEGSNAAEGGRPKSRCRTSACVRFSAMRSDDGYVLAGRRR